MCVCLFLAGNASKIERHIVWLLWRKTGRGKGKRKKAEGQEKYSDVRWKGYALLLNGSQKVGIMAGAAAATGAQLPLARLTQKDVKFMNMNERSCDPRFPSLFFLFSLFFSSFPAADAAAVVAPTSSLHFSYSKTGPNVINTSDPDMQAGSKSCVDKRGKLKLQL